MIAAETRTGASRMRIARSSWLSILLTSVLISSVPFLFPLDGRVHADWLQFVGRFHPALLHVPIGLILLLPVLEIGGAKRPALRESADFVLRAALAAALPTLALGYMLAYGSGDTGTSVTHHMAGAIALCIGLMLCVATRPAWIMQPYARIYPSVLAATLLTLIWTAHQGGSITHGSDYLTHYMPPRLRRIAAVGTSEHVAPDSFYAQHVHPVLDAKCVACHSASNAKGGLRLDTLEGVIHGGRDGAVVLPGRPESSPLLARVTLSPSDKHFMPAEGRTPLTSEEIALLRGWIRNGASPTSPSVPGVNVVVHRDDSAPLSVGDYSTLTPEIQRMLLTQGAKLVPVSSKPSDGLILRTLDVAPAFDDAQLARFSKFAPYIVEAELGRTAVTDAAFDTLRNFTHLRALHLEGTSITGSGLAKLASLSQLRYLNLSSTTITAESVAVLKKMPQLEHIYLFNTAAQPSETLARNTQ